MELKLIEEIESLPPLPKTLLKIIEFENTGDLQPEALLTIIEKDPLVISTLLKAANSSLFGFRGSVETPSRAINLLGINFSLAVIMSSILNNLVKTDLSPYGISDEDFMNTTQLQFKLTQLWVASISPSLKDELLLPSLLQEIGKFVISSILISENKEKEFKELVSLYKSDIKAEKEFVGRTTSEVTSMVFKHWRLNDELSSIIEHIDSPKKSDCSKTAYLHVIKTACNLMYPLSDSSIHQALAEAKEFNLDEELLKKALKTLQKQLETQ